MLLGAGKVVVRLSTKENIVTAIAVLCVPDLQRNYTSVAQANLLTR